MIRGTTAEFQFKVPYPKNEIMYMKVIFWQPGNDGPSETRQLPITKCSVGDFKWSTKGDTVTVKLEPEETARFVETSRAKVQLSATTHSGIRFASDQQDITVYPIYKDSDVDWEDVVVPPSEFDGVYILDGRSVAEG